MGVKKLTREWYVTTVVESVVMGESESFAEGTVKIDGQVVRWRANLQNGFVRFEQPFQRHVDVKDVKRVVLGTIGLVNLPKTKTDTVYEI